MIFVAVYVKKRRKKSKNKQNESLFLWKKLLKLWISASVKLVENLKCVKKDCFNGSCAKPQKSMRG